MAEKLDFRKEYKDLYMPGTKPVLVTVPPMSFLMIDGKGAPEGDAYKNAIGVLYALSFTIKMSKMSGRQPEGYVEYVMPPLEGLWDCGTVGFSADRDAWRWTSLLRQPDFVTPAVFAWAKEEAARKKPELDFSLVRFESFAEGLCVQMMHIGPYSEEQKTIDTIGAYIAQNELVDDCGFERRHHEIYISDPRRIAPDKMKTVLRHPVHKG